MDYFRSLSVYEIAHNYYCAKAKVVIFFLHKWLIFHSERMSSSKVAEITFSILLKKPKLNRT